jgi:hypothetical protein
MSWPVTTGMNIHLAQHGNEAEISMMASKVAAKSNPRIF